MAERVEVAGIHLCPGERAVADELTTCGFAKPGDDVFIHVSAACLRCGLTGITRTSTS